MLENDRNGTAGAGTEKTFTQAEMDAIIEGRLAREKQKYADYEDLKEKRNFRKQQREWKPFGKSWISLRARKL